MSGDRPEIRPATVATVGPPPPRAPMVGWFNPRQLVQTGLQAFVSTLIGAHSDRRAIEALRRDGHVFYDYTRHYRERPDGSLEPDPERPRSSIGIDFVADVGDGWNATYAVAHTLAQPRLELVHEGETVPTRRGDLLIFGGDEVYPAPSRLAYERRLIDPYRTAMGDDRPEEAPHVFALPGNHDWYDSLVAWSRLFCSTVLDRRFAGWRTRQERSYFALKLPHGWWWFGADGQLQADIDAGQIDYFRAVAEKEMQPGDRVILCLASPSWIYAAKYARYGGYDESDLIYLLERVLAPRQVEVSVFLSGDLHHYRRHEEIAPADPEAPVQKVTAGGGGAFLHPTHGDDVEVITEQPRSGTSEGRRFRLRAAFPPAATSKRLVWRNLWFPFLNPWFGIVPGLFYLLAVWVVGGTMGWKRPRHLLDPMLQTLSAFRDHPLIGLGFIATVGAFVFFTDTHSRLYKWLGGICHASAHYLALFYVGWGTGFLIYRGLPNQPFLQFLAGATLVFGAGWIVGSVIVGLYLLVSYRVWGRHSEEAFSSLRIEDHKSFLRLRIAEDGSLTLYPIGIDRVPRVWRDRRDDEAQRTPSLVVPEDGSAPRLIEAPIRLAGPPSSR